MSTTTDVDTSVLNDLDFEPVLPCEFPTHPDLHDPSDPGAWVLVMQCPVCGHCARVIVCNSGRLHQLRVGVRDTACGTRIFAGQGVTYVPIGGAS